MKGMEGFTGMYVGEIPPGGALHAENHLYEELIYIIKGVGATEIWSAGDGKASGIEAEFEYWAVCTFSSGKLLRSELFTDRAEALEAAGLRE